MATSIVVEYVLDSLELAFDKRESNLHVVNYFLQYPNDAISTGSKPYLIVVLSWYKATDSMKTCPAGSKVETAIF